MGGAKSLCLRTLDFAGNRCGTATCEEVATLISDGACDLERLCLDRTRCGDEGAEILAAALSARPDPVSPHVPWVPGLRCVSLRGCGVGSRGGSSLAAATKGNGVLLYCFLEYNTVPSKAMRAVEGNLARNRDGMGEEECEEYLYPQEASRLLRSSARSGSDSEHLLETRSVPPVPTPLPPADAVLRASRSTSLHHRRVQQETGTVADVLALSPATVHRFAASRGSTQNMEWSGVWKSGKREPSPPHHPSSVSSKGAHGVAPPRVYSNSPTARSRTGRRMRSTTPVRRGPRPPSPSADAWRRWQAAELGTDVDPQNEELEEDEEERESVWASPKTARYPRSNVKTPRSPALFTSSPATDAVAVASALAREAEEALREAERRKENVGHLLQMFANANSANTTSSRQRPNHDMDSTPAATSSSSSLVPRKWPGDATLSLSGRSPPKSSKKRHVSSSYATSIPTRRDARPPHSSSSPTSHYIPPSSPPRLNASPKPVPVPSPPPSSSSSSSSKDHHHTLSSFSPPHRHRPPPPPRTPPQPASLAVSAAEKASADASSTATSVAERISLSRSIPHRPPNTFDLDHNRPHTSIWARKSQQPPQRSSHRLKKSPSPHPSPSPPRPSKPSNTTTAPPSPHPGDTPNRRIQPAPKPPQASIPKPQPLRSQRPRPPSIRSPERETKETEEPHQTQSSTAPALKETIYDVTPAGTPMHAHPGVPGSVRDLQQLSPRPDSRVSPN